MASALLLGYLVPIVAGGIGMGVALYVAIKKRKSESFICLLRMECDPVIYGEYSSFLGIPVENIGLVYFSLVTFAYAAFLLYPPAMLHSLVVILFTLTVIALLFAIYLAYIQIITLRQVCSWCFIPLIMCVIIFFSTLFGAPRLYQDISRTLIAWQEVLFGIQLLGIALALGGVTLYQFFFYRFLSDLRISKWESSVLHAISQITWLGLCILLLAWLGLIIANTEQYLSSGLFHAQVIVMAIIIISDAYINLTIAPRLVHIIFDNSQHHAQSELQYERKLAFIGGAISLVSWYTLFVLFLLADHVIRFNIIILIYVILLIIGLVAGMIAEHVVSKRTPIDD